MTYRIVDHPNIINDGDAYICELEKWPGRKNYFLFYKPGLPEDDAVAGVMDCPSPESVEMCIRYYPPENLKSWGVTCNGTKAIIKGK